MIEPEVGSNRVALTLKTIAGDEISLLLEEFDAEDIGAVLKRVTKSC
jgi:hypothetical protein